MKEEPHKLHVQMQHRLDTLSERYLFEIAKIQTEVDNFCMFSLGNWPMREWKMDIEKAGRTMPPCMQDF
jgi:hypothetical protein